MEIEETSETSEMAMTTMRVATRPASGEDEVDATLDKKELTDFEVQMEIRLFKLVYSHLKGETACGSWGGAF